MSIMSQFFKILFFAIKAKVFFFSFRAHLELSEGTSLVAQTVKRLSTYVGDPGSIPGSGRSPGEGNGNPLQYIAWKIPWIEEPGRLQSMGLQRVRHD